MNDNILLVASAATTFVKVLIDLLKLSPLPTPGPLPAILTVPVGILIVVLLDIYGGTALDAPTLAGATLAGILAAGAAIGVTEIGRRAE